MEKTNFTHQATSYELLIASEEKGRTLIESALYLLLIGAAMVSIWQFSNQPVTFNRFGSTSSTSQSQLAG